MKWWQGSNPKSDTGYQQWLVNSRCNGVTLTIEELLRYQQKAGILDLSPRVTNQAQLAGNYLAKSKGRGMEFDEVRQYNAGDDIRTIDWRVTARTGKTHTKLFREEKERPIFILCDLSDDMFFGSQLLFKSVQAAHLTALIAWNAKQRGDKVGGLVFNQETHRELKPKSRQHGVLQILHALTSLHQTGIEHLTKPRDGQKTAVPGKLFEEACARLRHLAHPGSLIFLISDFKHTSEITMKHLSQIARHNEVVAYEISDPMEHELPNSQYKQSLQVSDGVNIQTVVIGDKGSANQYRNTALQHYNETHQSLKKLKIQVAEISAAVPIEEQLKSGVKV